MLEIQPVGWNVHILNIKQSISDQLSRLHINCLFSLKVLIIYELNFLNRRILNLKMLNTLNWFSENPKDNWCNPIFLEQTLHLSFC